MSLLLVPVPIFNQDMAVEAYLFRYLADKSAYIDGYSPIFEALRKVELDAFSFNKPLICPVDAPVLLSEDFSFPPNRIVLLLERDVPAREPYLSVVRKRREQGFRLAVEGWEREALLQAADCALIDASFPAGERGARLRQLRRQSTALRLIGTSIPTAEAFQAAAAEGFTLFEGRFYSQPVTQRNYQITPLKSNLIHLLNVVRDENFEFSVVASIVRNDPALSVSLMRFINSPYIGVRRRVKDIHQAVVLLGQLEVRKWVTAAVFKSIGADRPNELTRLSMLRAKFAESLAALFGMGGEAQSLFLMGLFSVLDVILEVDMRSALRMVLVSDDIYRALIDADGRYYPVLRFMLNYERAAWDAVIDQCGALHLTMEQVFEAYLNALFWYNELISDKVRPNR